MITNPLLDPFPGEKKLVLTRRPSLVSLLLSSFLLPMHKFLSFCSRTIQAQKLSLFFISNYVSSKAYFKARASFSPFPTLSFVHFFSENNDSLAYHPEHQISLRRLSPGSDLEFQ